MFNSQDRVWLIFLWVMVANMGLAIGPIISSYITASLGWYVDLQGCTNFSLKMSC